MMKKAHNIPNVFRPKLSHRPSPWARGSKCTLHMWGLPVYRVVTRWVVVLYETAVEHVIANIAEAIDKQTIGYGFIRKLLTTFKLSVNRFLQYELLLSEVYATMRVDNLQLHNLHFFLDGKPSSASWDFQ